MKNAQSPPFAKGHHTQIWSFPDSGAKKAQQFTRESPLKSLGGKEKKAIQTTVKKSHEHCLLWRPTGAKNKSESSRGKLAGYIGSQISDSDRRSTPLCS
jgi:hypothetical protein